MKRKRIRDWQWLHQLGYVLVVALSWLMVGVGIWNVDPETVKDVGVSQLYLPMLLLIWWTLCVTLRLVWRSWLRGLLWGGGVTLLLGLRIVDLDSWLNFGLVGLLVGLVEYYWRTSEQ